MIQRQTQSNPACHGSAVTPHRSLRALLATAVLLQGGAALAQAARTADCLIEPQQRLEIRSTVAGLIRSIGVDRGSMVQKGQVLVELDAGVEAAALAGARYRARMAGEVQAAEARSRFAQAKLGRLDEMAKEELVSRNERDEAEASARVAESDLVVARENRELAQLEAQRLAELLEQRRVRSPVAGIVTDRLQQPGELALAGEGARPILRLAVTHPLRVEVVLPVARLGSVRVGEAASIEPEPPLKGRWTATVRQIDRVVDAASGTFRVQLDLPNADGAITSGVKCTVSFK
jgi:RND family efflux transporter MFP subunit